MTMGVAVVVAGMSALFSAMVLMGGVVSAVRDDHRNPVARAFLDWYAGLTHAHDPTDGAVILGGTFVIESQQDMAHTARVLRAGEEVAFLRVYEGAQGHTRIEIAPVGDLPRSDLLIRLASRRRRAQNE
ncbi:MAG TPA: hypothetical protein VGQ45_14255 [Gaiellales bacterium]|nr:hypothetical protein [Gaiellales bacterium]